VKASVILLATLALPSRMPAQQPPAPPATVDVFLDCQNFYCDFDHIRREITFVNWVRDRQDADVHILATEQSTGGGGGEYTFTFIGLRAFAGRSDTLRYVSRNTDTETEIRDGHVRIIKLGLMRYVAQTPARDRLQISYRPDTAAAAVGPPRDPWNLWVFTLSAYGYLQGEEQQAFDYVNGSVTANRTSDRIKINLRLSGSYNRSSQELSTGPYVNATHSYSGSDLAAWSLGPHWSFGVHSAQLSSTYYNEDLALRAGPVLEYNLFPYSQSTRRQLAIRYSPEVGTYDYEEPTIFGKTKETLPDHRLDVTLLVQQPWGQVATSANAVQFLHDPTKYRLMLTGYIEFRVFRGLSLSVDGTVERLKDQLYLSSAGLTDEEILVRRRQLGTNFTYFTYFTVSYRFGSKFANVVNSRMPNISSYEF
jgi:hypothetical protein